MRLPGKYWMVLKVIERLKDAFINMDGWAKSLLLHAYFAGMAFFIMAWIFGQGFVGIGILTGVFSGIIIEPLLSISDKSGQQKRTGILLRFRLARCVLFSVFICYLIALGRFALATNVFDFEFEPFSFGLVYGLIHVLIFSAIKKIWGLLRKNSHNEQ